MDETRERRFAPWMRWTTTPFTLAAIYLLIYSDLKLFGVIVLMAAQFGTYYFALATKPKSSSRESAQQESVPRESE